jgi:branched-chain amino acid transport system substrate-binding protein
MLRRFLGIVLALSMLMLTGCGGQAAAPAQSVPKAAESKPADAKPAATVAAVAPAQPTAAPVAKPAEAKPAAPAAPAPAAATKAVPGVTDGEIVLGTWGPVTGPASAWGVIGRAHEAYFQMVNESGGIHGRKVKLIFEDDGYSPAKTVPLVKKLIEEDKIFALLGGLGTPSNTAVLEYVIQNGVPHIAPSTGSSKWSDPVQPGYYAWQINYKTEARILVKYGTETLGKKKFAIFYQNDDYGKEGLEEAKVQLAKRNVELVAEVAYNVTDSDYSAHAVKLQQSGAEAVLTWPSVKQYGSLLKETWKIGYKPTWLNSATVSDPALIKLAPDEVQDAYFIGYLPDPNDPANAEIPAIKQWRENLPKYNKDLPLSNFTLYGWGQARLMHETLNRAGKDLTREGLEKAAQSLSEWQDLATVTYTPTDRRGIIVGWMVQAKGENTVKITDPIKAD